jgi:hypothetical protein
MADGINRGEFARRFREAGTTERVRLVGRYVKWTLQGARAQDGYRYGVIPLLLPIYAAILWHREFGSVGLYLACVIATALGAYLTIIALRGERAWRRANLFQYSDEDA